jgi:hypothetical protein
MNSKSTPGPRRTKYYNIVLPRVKTPRYQHVGLVRYRTEDPEWDDDEILIPQNIGRHVMDEYHRAPRKSQNFHRLQPKDLFFPLTSLKEWERLEQEGIDITDALVTVGELLLANDQKLGKWKCKPSPLRSCWAYV